MFIIEQKQGVHYYIRPVSTPEEFYHLSTSEKIAAFWHSEKMDLFEARALFIVPQQMKAIYTSDQMMEQLFPRISMEQHDGKSYLTLFVPCDGTTATKNQFATLAKKLEEIICTDPSSICQ
jgi:hypothetical protein